MSQINHSLRGDLTRTMLKWSGILFVLIALVFALGYNRLSTLILAHEARYVLNYQTPEFAKHLLHNNIREIDGESKSLIAAGEAEGIVVLNNHNHVIDAAFDKRLMANSTTHLKYSLSSVKHVLQEDPGAIVFKRIIPNGSSSIWLVMDRRPMINAIFTSTTGIVLLLLALLVIAITSLHFALRRRLVTPLEEVQQLLDTNQPATDLALQKLETSLPEEAINILHLYEQIKTTHEGLRSHFSQMLDIVPSCLWWADHQGYYQQLSGRAAELFGRQPEQLVGKNLWDWLFDQDQAKHNREKLDHAVRQQAKHLNLAYADTQADNQPRWFGEQLTIQYDNSGLMNGLYGICNDITERRQQEHTLQSHEEQARRMDAVGTLVGGIAHEFNNMLAGIVGNTFLLRHNMESNPKALERLDRVDRLIQRASTMIEQLLAFARKSQAQRGKISLKTQLEDILRTFQPAVKSGAQIISDINSEAYVIADRAQIQQAITHLLNNADLALIDIPNPTITIRMNEFEGDDGFLDRNPDIATLHLIHITVSDNGCGIEPDAIDRIFEPFFSTREIGEGTGLGLSMVYGMVHHLGGVIEVESSPGVGTSFHLYLPRAEELSIEDDASGEIFYGRGETILLVEDELAMRKRSADALEKLGYKVVEAIDGLDALHRFEEHQQDIRLLMSTLIMPRIGGTKLATMIRKKAHNLPVLFMTAHDLSNSLRMDISLPNSDVISKPFHFASLSVTLRRLINSRTKP